MLDSKQIEACEKAILEILQAGPRDMLSLFAEVRRRGVQASSLNMAASAFRLAARKLVEVHDGPGFSLPPPEDGPGKE